MATISQNYKNIAKKTALIKSRKRFFTRKVAMPTPLSVIDKTTGVIVQEIKFDEFGNITADTNPGFTPFGFAGCLYDVETKLCRFGARDYNPIIGRWLNRDPKS